MNSYVQIMMQLQSIVWLVRMKIAEKMAYEYHHSSDKFVYGCSEL